MEILTIVGLLKYCNLWHPPHPSLGKLLRKEFPELGKKYWGLHIWARGYFVSTVGIDSEIIRKDEL